jgi:hypothetical protein
MRAVASGQKEALRAIHLEDQNYFNPMKPGPRVLLILLPVLHLSSAVASENNIAFLGPKGSYSDQAASEWVSRAGLASSTSLDTITQIALAVGTGGRSRIVSGTEKTWDSRLRT